MKRRDAKFNYQGKKKNIIDVIIKYNNIINSN